MASKIFDNVIYGFTQKKRGGVFFSSMLEFPKCVIVTEILDSNNVLVEVF